MKLEYEVDGEIRDFECFDNWASEWTCDEILKGHTYPAVPLAAEVGSVLDIGANCGAASVALAARYPNAVVHAFEPAKAAFDLLRLNTASVDRIKTWNLALHAESGIRDLHLGKHDAGSASLFDGPNTSDVVESVTVQSLADWLAAEDLDAIDVMKIDTEGCEVPILTSLGHRLAEVQLVYLEYHSESDRLEIERLMLDTHALVLGRMLLDIGEVAYVRRSQLPEDRDSLNRLLFEVATQAAPGAR